MKGNSFRDRGKGEDDDKPSRSAVERIDREHEAWSDACLLVTAAWTQINQPHLPA